MVSGSLTVTKEESLCCSLCLCRDYLPPRYNIGAKPTPYGDQGGGVTGCNIFKGPDRRQNCR